jgi:hypothetical protein
MTFLDEFEFSRFFNLSHLRPLALFEASVPIFDSQRIGQTLGCVMGCRRDRREPVTL